MKKYINIMNKWNDFRYNIHNQFINENIIKIALDSFHDEVLKRISSDHVIDIIFKINSKENICRSVSYMQTVKVNNFNKIHRRFVHFWNIRSENYHINIFEEIIFTYRITPLDQSNEEDKLVSHKNWIIDNNDHSLGGYNLPKTMNLDEWGKCYYSKDGYEVKIYKENSDLVYTVKFDGKYNHVELRGGETVILKFVDEIIDENNLSTFIRKINDKHEYFYENGGLEVKKIKRKVSFLKLIQKMIYITYEFITMDLETRKVNGEHIPYCVNIYDGKEHKSFYLLDYDNHDIMLEESIKYLMHRKYDDQKVYLHNWSYFDGVFLLRILSNLSDKIRIKKRDGRLIDVKFSYGNNYNLYFRDSYLILPSNLRKLATSFGVESKGIFPYKFVNCIHISLDYIGKFPRIKFFEDLNLSEYINYKYLFNNKLWNLREETIKYCQQDCISLHQIITKFNENIFEMFRLDIHKYPTISSLAFAIYRSNFYKDEYNIPLIHGEIYDFIRRSYTGGRVDVFKPFGYNIEGYDVNSLYPYVMRNNSFPIGTPTYFEGDIRKVDADAFGFFEVEIETTRELNIPFLQTKVKVNDESKTISPLGNWRGVYFSEEIKNAEINGGYKFKILRGYLFEKENIFKEYVDFLYELKSSSNKGSAHYNIAKLLLNSLYGRFGMDPYMETHVIIKESEYTKYKNDKNIVTDTLDFKNGKLLVSYFNPNSKNSDRLNLSIPISSAVTAYSRIHMNNLINELVNLGYNVYYTDTDSLFVDRPLPDHMISKMELGKLKLEYTFKKAIFLAPKVYGGVLNSGKELVKIKGYKNSISFKELSLLLYKNSKIELEQEKWYRDFKNGRIKVNDEIYTLTITENKRKMLYNQNNIFIDTKPLKIREGMVY